MNLDIFYPAKILLFGEYTVINGGNALAMPFGKYGGCWKKRGNLAQQMQLRAWSNYLQERFEDFQFKEMESALNEGLYFDSNIPTGYGLGSSGAVCAAVYDIFFDKKEKKLEALKRVFATMESFFHGKSSGFDPLVSYLRASIFLEGKKQIQKFDLSPLLNPSATKPFQFFLLDTGMSRETSPLVQDYLVELKQEAFAKIIKEALLPANNIAIQAMMSADWKTVEKQFKIISKIQYESFQKMIPNEFRTLWYKGMLTNDFSLKLCGAGGGGFLLGYTSKKIDFENVFSPYKILKF